MPINDETMLAMLLETRNAPLRAARRTDIRTVPVVFPLRHANEALNALRDGRFDGAAVLLPDRPA